MILNNTFCFKGYLGFYNLRLFAVTKYIDTNDNDNDNDVPMTQPGLLEHKLCNPRNTREKDNRTCPKRSYSLPGRSECPPPPPQLTKLSMKQIVYFKRLSQCV